MTHSGTGLSSWLTAMGSVKNKRREDLIFK